MLNIKTAATQVWLYSLFTELCSRDMQASPQIFKSSKKSLNHPRHFKSKPNPNPNHPNLHNGHYLILLHSVALF